MTTLNVLRLSQISPASGTIFWYITYGVPDIGGAGSSAVVIQIGASQNLTTSPATFTSIDSAQAYYDAIIPAQLLATVNSMAGTTFYTGFNISIYTTNEQAIIAQIPTVPTNVSAFTNDAGYITPSALSGLVTSSSLSSTLSAYVTGSSLSSTLTAYATSAALTATLAGYATTGALAAVAASIPTNTNQLTNGAGFLLPSSLAPYLTIASAASTYATNSALSAYTTTANLKGSVVANDSSVAGATVSAALNTLLASLPQSRVYSTPSFASATTATQLSTTRHAQVTYDISATVNISLLAGQSITATLTYADNSAMTTNPVVVSAQTVANSGILGLTQVNTIKLSGGIPAGKYRQITFTSSGSPTLPTTLQAAQEILI